jgi:hypothetical protein
MKLPLQLFRKHHGHLASELLGVILNAIVPTSGNRGTDLSFCVFDKIRTVDSAAIVENKRPGATLAFIQQQQNALPLHTRHLDPERRRYANKLDMPTAPAS